MIEIVRLSAPFVRGIDVNRENLVFARLVFAIYISGLCLPPLEASAFYRGSAVLSLPLLNYRWTWSLQSRIVFVQLSTDHLNRWYSDKTNPW